MWKKLLELYAKLDSELGTRDWKQEWPAETPYEVAIGAVLTQNTNWKNAEKAIANLRREGLINRKKILETRNAKLETLIRPAGYYRQKAKRLKLMTKTYGRLLEMDNLAEMRRLLLETHGIGKETADSILLYAFGRPVFVIDAYTKRFCKKFFRKEWENYDDCQRFFEKNLPKDAELYKEYHALIVEWAKRQKTKRE